MSGGIPRPTSGGLDSLVNELSLEGLPPGAPHPPRPPVLAAPRPVAAAGSSALRPPRPYGHEEPSSSSSAASYYSAQTPRVHTPQTHHHHQQQQQQRSASRPDSFYSPPAPNRMPQFADYSPSSLNPETARGSDAAYQSLSAHGSSPTVERSAPPSPAGPPGLHSAAPWNRTSAHGTSAASGSTSAAAFSPFSSNDQASSQFRSRGSSTPNSVASTGHSFPPSNDMMNSAASFLASRPATPQSQSPFGAGYQPAMLASASRIFDQGSQVLRPGAQASLLSHEKTLELYRKNAQKVQDPDLMYELAVFMVESSRSSPENAAPSSSQDLSELVKEAMALLRKIADRGHPDAQYFLADCHANGLGSNGKPQFDKAYPLFVLAAKHAHADASYRAGICVEHGWGCRKDHHKAIQFYKKAATQGHPGAMFRLATSELNGELGLKKNAKEGVKWIRLAADAATPEFPHALHELALLHERGIDNVVFHDHEYACELLARAAELGYAPSAYKLGANYEYGKMGCPSDPGLSIHMYNIAAQQNHKEACFALCAWYLVGAPGILPQSDTEAYLWAKKAAEQGLAKAEYAVGYFTEMGIGTKRNLPESKAWYLSALEHGDKRAHTRLVSMGRVMAAMLPTPSVQGGGPAGTGSSASTSRLPVPHSPAAPASLALRPLAVSPHDAKSDSDSQSTASVVKKKRNWFR